MTGSLFHVYWISGPSGAKMEEHVFLTLGPVNESEYEATVSSPLYTHIVSSFVTFC